MLLVSLGGVSEARAQSGSPPPLMDPATSPGGPSVATPMPDPATSPNVAPRPVDTTDLGNALVRAAPVRTAPRPLAAAGSEDAARAREPFVVAPGSTPVDEPLRATSAHRFSRVRVEGFFRTRSDLGYGWDLNRGPTPMGAPLWPAAYIDGGQSRLQTNLDMRLRLDVEVSVGYGVTLRTRLHALDNVRFGSLPDADFVGGSVSQRAPSLPIDVRQLYGEVLLPIGVLRAGRMGALVDWGTGFFVNAGNGVDDDFGDVGDRISFTTSLGGLLWTGLFENSASGPATDVLDSRVRPAFDLDPRDDVRTVSFGVARWDTPTTRRRLLAASRTRFDFGLMGAYRWQDYDYAPMQSPTSPRASIARGLSVWLGDAWARLDVGRLTLEAEVGLLSLNVKNISLDPTVMTNIPVTGLQIGGVVRADWRASERVFARVELGFASGDSAPGFGARPQNITPTQPGDLDGPQFNLAAGDTTIDNFRFHPNYRVDLILFRRIVGMLTDVAYARPMVRWRVASMLTLEAAAIASLAMIASTAPGGAAPLGVETDLSATYEQEWGFAAKLEYGLLIPLAGFADVVRGVGAAPAHALRATMAFRF